MTSEPVESGPQEEPVAPQTERVQTADPGVAVIRVRPADVQTGIEQSPLAAAIRESDAVANAAASTIMRGWAQEDHARRRRVEDELRETRARLENERDRRIRAETRLDEVTRNRAAQDMMILVGGAALGFGFTALFEHAWALGAAGVIGGVVVTGGGFLLANLRRKGGSHGQ